MKSSTVKVKLTLDVDTVDVFRLKYPRLMSTYVRRCLAAAVQDKDIFDTIFFNYKDAAPFKLDRKYSIKEKDLRHGHS